MALGLNLSPTSVLGTGQGSQALPLGSTAPPPRAFLPYTVHPRGSSSGTRKGEPRRSEPQEEGGGYPGHPVTDMILWTVVTLVPGGNWPRFCCQWLYQGGDRAQTSWSEDCPDPRAGSLLIPQECLKIAPRPACTQQPAAQRGFFTAPSRFPPVLQTQEATVFQGRPSRVAEAHHPAQRFRCPVLEGLPGHGGCPPSAPGPGSQRRL